MLNIGHVVRRFVRTEWGGTESSVLHHAHEGILQGHHHTIFTTSMFSQPGHDQMEQVPIRRYGYTFPWFGLSAHDRHLMELKGGNPISFSMMKGLFCESKLDLIHTHVLHRLGGTARSVAKWRGIPYVVSLHGGHLTLPSSVAREMQQPFLGKWEWGKAYGLFVGSRRTLDDADAIFCVGKDEWEQMQERYPKKRVEYVPNGVDIPRFAKGRPELFRERFGIEGPILLCVSRIDPQKNQELLIDAFAEFSKKHRDHTLVLLGPCTVPHLAEELRQRAESLGVGERVKLINGLTPDDPLLPAAYKAAESFILPSKHEPFGIVILEAWAAGVPVIASAVGGIPGFTTDEKDVFLFPSEDKGKLIAQMERLASDPQTRQQLADAGREAVKPYAWSEISRQVHTLYRELL